MTAFVRPPAFLFWFAVAVWLPWGTGATAGEVAQKPLEQQDIAKLNTHDALTKARLEAIEGRHETCARLADHARRQKGASWHAHHVFATCQVYAADEVKEEIGAQAYRERIETAIDAFQFLLNTPGVLIFDTQRNSVKLIVSELRKRIDG